MVHFHCLHNKEDYGGKHSLNERATCFISSVFNMAFLSHWFIFLAHSLLVLLFIIPS